MLVYGYRALAFSACTLPAGAMPVGSGSHLYSTFLYLQQFICENKPEAAVNSIHVIWMVTSYAEALNVANASVRIYFLAYY